MVRRFRNGSRSSRSLRRVLLVALASLPLLACGADSGEPASLGAGGAADGAQGGAAAAGQGALGGGQATAGSGAAAGGQGSGGQSTGGSVGSSSGGNGSTSGAGGAGSSQGGSSGSGGSSVVEPAEGDQWVSPSGDDANPGTEGSPLENLQTAVLRAQPNTTIWMMAGTHSYSARVGIKSNTVNLTMGTAGETAPEVGTAQDGQAGKPIRIFGVPGARPVIDFSPQRKIINDMAESECAVAPNNSAAAVKARNSSRGIALYAEYWHLKNLEVMGAADNCIYVAGSHNIIENVAIHDCGDTGLQITGEDESTVYLPSYNEIVNCDSYRNIDDLICETLPGEDADGYAAKLAIGPGNQFRGCRAWGNVDDGWDFFAGKMAQPPIVMENCWAFGMSHPDGNDRSDGNGFKLGGWRNESDRCVASLNTANHTLKGCFSFDNPGYGFDMNNNTATITCEGCGAWNNGCKTDDDCDKNFEVLEIECGTYQMQQTGTVTGLTVTAEEARNAKRDADGALPDIETL